MKRPLPLLGLALVAAAATACSSPSDQSATPASPSTAATGSYAMSEVAQHASDSSCWTAIDGSVYDVTSWIGQHPGGEDRIRGLCGKDGTSAFTGQHSGDTTPQQRLAGFKIGTLSG